MRRISSKARASEQEHNETQWQKVSQNDQELTKLFYQVPGGMKRLVQNAIQSSNKRPLPRPEQRVNMATTTKKHAHQRVSNLRPDGSNLAGRHDPRSNIQSKAELPNIQTLKLSGSAAAGRRHQVQSHQAE